MLVIGTSLGGLYADQVATECAERSRRGAALGAVIINLQQTPQDGKMTLNCFGKSDEARRAAAPPMALARTNVTRSH